ncbi:outer membrane protein with beta-barrel domain [Flavobacterium cutihirudinis]|uniref:Outer membrane protein with beta-barrel domain n=1 Tax=Flavobacterium cutihirudinis TaxID=1265740 RepID=A0A3D9FX91_9FLAO|nr:outer membrane beta-barrel protein [Flavobacterium cutihirudinis]RED25409.1 outer membrane protein with beta-barrel domain [Flavobacterium cutihirudinis]
MKKMLLIAMLAAFSAIHAQKGSVLVMGNIEYNSQSGSTVNSETKSNSFIFSPKVGFQFHENWTAGIEGGIGISKTELTTNEYSKSKSNIYSLGGFLRYSKPLNQTFSAYVDLGSGFTNQKNTSVNSVNSSDNTANGFYVGLTPAIFINVNKGFGLNFNIGGLSYNNYNYEDGVNVVKSFNFNFGKAFSVGISKHF